MPILSVEDLIQAIAGQITRAYDETLADDALWYQPSEGGIDIATPELPVVYPSWEFQFDLGQTVELCFSERDTHHDGAAPFPHCWMIDTQEFEQRTFATGGNTNEFWLALKIWFMYGYYHGGSGKKFRDAFTKVSKYVNNDLADLGMPDSGGLIEALPLNYISTDTHDFKTAVLHVAQGRMEFTLEL